MIPMNLDFLETSQRKVAGCLFSRFFFSLLSVQCETLKLTLKAEIAIGYVHSLLGQEYPSLETFWLTQYF